MPLRESFLARWYYRVVESSLLPCLARLPLTPNQITILGLLLAAVVPLGFYVHPWFGFLFMGLSGVADTLDGLVSRKLKKETRFGAFLDSSLDRVADFFYLSGFWVLFWRRDGLIPATALIFSALLFSFMISYTKARCEALGGTCQTGLMERGVRVLYLLAWALALSLFPEADAKILWHGLILFCVLTFWTMIRRLTSIRSEMKKQTHAHGIKS